MTGVMETKSSIDPRDGSPAKSNRVSAWFEEHWAFVLLAPGMILVLLMLAYPIGANLYQSFTNKNFQFPNTSFIGFENYTASLSDPVFWTAVKNSLLWTAVSVVGQLIIGLAGALLLEHIARGRTLYRLLLIIPWTFSSVVMAAVWRLMLDSLYGIINGYLTWSGLIDQPVAWFGDIKTSLWSAMIVNIWFGIPFMLLSLVAGLQTIPKDYYEAASVDGAGAWRKFFHITLPGLMPIITTLVVLRTIWVINNFDIVFLTTGGGPSNSSITLPVYAYQVGWSQFEIGRMSSVSVIMTVFLIVLALVFFKLTDKKSASED